MAVGNSVAIEDYQTARRGSAVVVPMDFDEPLPQPTADLETAKADLRRAGYAILTGAVVVGVLLEYLATWALRWWRNRHVIDLTQVSETEGSEDVSA